MQDKITYYVVYSWMYLHALLPFKALYVLSDILYVIAYRIIRYRLKVVRKNMKNSFPEKTQKELRKMEKEFYHHFCDYIVETIKLLHISDKQMLEHIQFKNTGLVKELTKEGNSCLMYLGHYGNWEWVPAITLLFDKNLCTGQIYRRLKNQAFDKIFLDLRKRFGSIGIAKEDTLRKIIQLKNEGVTTLIGFMSDQSPSPSNLHYWTKLLNQDTGVYTGVERIAKKTGFSVIYLDMEKIARGKYICECRLITNNPKEEPKFLITEKYIREFEKTILRNPAYWLWTHNRWKYKKENFVK